MLPILVLVLCAGALATPVEHDSKIVGGEIAIPTQFPYMANILQLGSNAHVCGGAILNQNWIITSATCVQRWGGAGNIEVRVGSITVTGGDIHFVGESFLHPQFDSFTKRYDVALLHVTSPIQYSDEILPITLDDTPVVEDETVVYSGWGSSGPDDHNPSSLLRFLDALTIAELECVIRYPSHNIHPSQLCSVTPVQHGACLLDEGNPIVRNGLLVGVQSYLYDCGTGVPDVHARISYTSIFEWIELTISAM